MTEEQLGGVRTSRAAVTPPPALILLLGLLTTGVCMLLLFGPFYPDHGSPGVMLQRALISLSDHLPRVVRLLLWNRFFLVTLLVFGVFLALVPWRVAVHRRGARSGSSPHRPAGFSAGRQVTRTERDVSLSFVDDGSIVSDDGDGQLTRSVPDLRMMADATGIPWHTDYETEGGARAFLEVVRALHDGPAGVLRAEDQAGTAPAETPAATASVSAVPASAPSAAPAGSTAPSAPAPAPFDGDAPGLTGTEDEDVDRSDGHRLSEPTWSSSFSSAVYTPTDLYRSARIDPTTPDGADSADDSEGTAGER